MVRGWHSIWRFWLVTLFGLFLAITAQGLNSVAVTLNSSPNPANYGQAVTLTATVTSGATGKVTFYDGTTILGVGTISGTTASLTTPLLGSGTRSLRAHYGGDFNNSPGNSIPVSQTVVPAVSLGLSAAVNYGTATGPYSVAVGDFNRDGKADLAVPNFNSGSVSILLGNGDGTFQTAVNYLTDPGQSSVLVADWNGDGIQDLATVSTSSISILLGNGDGSFRNPVKMNVATLQFAAQGDFNGDGKVDLVMVTFFPNTLVILLGNGDGTFQPPMNSSLPAEVFSVAVGDLNGDGKADLVFGGGNSYVTVLLGNGDGTFGAPLNYNAEADPTNVALGDFNGDGKVDIAEIGSFNYTTLGVLLGNGDGTFQPPTFVTAQPGSLVTADLNGDGKLDIVIASPNSLLVTLLGNGDGTFAASSYPLPSSVYGALAVADFNGDGKADVAVAPDTTNNVSILLGESNAILGIASSHSGSFYAGQLGATYSVTVSNQGSGAIADTFTVTDALPAGMSAIDISGMGWTCVLATVSCTQSSSLSAGGLFEPITVTVVVSANAPSQLTNVVRVSAPGAASASGSDVTNIAALPPPVPTAPSNGQTGVSLTPTLQWNASASATSYDVYLGTQSTPPLVTNTTATSYAPPTLTAGTVYYWRVVSKNTAGVSTSPTLSFITQAATGFAPIRVHAGGGAYMDPGTGNSWVADTGFLDGSTFSAAVSISNTTTVPLYESERWSAGTLEYLFAAPNGTYTVNLKFAEIYFNSPGQRVFNIVLNGQTVLANFDVLQAAGGPDLAIDKPFTVTVTNGQIDIQLVGVVSNPKISAIEITAGTVPPPPPPTGFTPIRVHAGGAAYTDPGTGNLWSADRGFLDGSTYSTLEPIQNTTTPSLYQSERWSAGTLEYSFGVPNGSYVVNLKFAEIYYSYPGQRIFNVVLNGQTVLTSFDPLNAAGGRDVAIDKPFAVTVTNGKIDIQLVGVVSNPKISAIEITAGTVQSPPPPPGFTPIRVHAGGGAYTDPGTSNLWSSDTGFLDGSTFSTNSSIGNTTTPPLYQSERWSTGTLEYSFTVPNGAHTVNLKFAEIYFTSSGQRVFNIVLNGQTVVASFDPFVAAGGANLAIDKSFPVTVTNGKIDIQLVGVVSNPKISAIEIQ